MKLHIRTLLLFSASYALLIAQPAMASVIFNVSGVWDDGGTLLGTFTTSDDLLNLEATSLIVAGGTNGIDSVNFNDQSYITAGANNLPNGFFLNAVSSVTKTLRLSFASPISTMSTSLLAASSTNTQDGVGSRSIVSGSVTPQVLTASVPEPSTWAMMIFGFVAVGSALRSGKRRVGFEAARA